MSWRIRRNEWWRVATLIAAIFCLAMAYQATLTPTHQEFEIEKSLEMEPDYKTIWLSGGMKQVVSTYKDSGETDAEASARHKAKVTAHLVEFPKDPDPV